MIVPFFVFLFQNKPFRIVLRKNDNQKKVTCQGVTPYTVDFNQTGRSQEKTLNVQCKWQRLKRNYRDVESSQPFFDCRSLCLAVISIFIVLDNAFLYFYFLFQTIL